MSEELKPDEAKRFVECITEVLGRPMRNVRVSTEDLKFLQSVLDRGVLDKKVRELLTNREHEMQVEKIRAQEAAQRAEAARLEVARKEAAQAEMDLQGDDSVDQEVDKVGNWLQKCPMTSSTTSLNATEDTTADADTTSDSMSDAFIPTANDPRVDFLSFIDTGDAFLMLEKSTFPLEYALTDEKIGYPLGVAYDEISKNWLICDRDNHKIMRMSVEKDEIQVTASTKIKNPSALVIYEEGKSVAILCSEDRKKEYTIYLYNIAKPFIRIFASYRDGAKFDMKYQLRGLAKSVSNNLLSIELAYNGPKRLRVFKKDVGAKAFDLKGAQNPSFIAAYRSTVAISDLGTQKVFIYQLDDRDWNNISFMLTKVIESNMGPPDQVANESGFVFVSGMQFDSNGFLLIGDAKGHTIKLYDTEYTFLHRVSSDFALPYMSSFHVNSDGEVMMLDVHADPKHKLVWAKLKSINEIRPWRMGQGPQHRFGVRAQPPYQKRGPNRLN